MNPSGENAEQFNQPPAGAGHGGAQGDPGEDAADQVAVLERFVPIDFAGGVNY